MTTFTPDEQALVDVLKDDQKTIESFFEVPPKFAEGSRVPFKFAGAQQKFYDQRKLRNIVIKGSQMRSTTLWTALGFKRTMFRPDYTSVVVAHDGFLAERLLQRTEIFYEAVPEAVRPKMDHRSATEKRFPAINSVMYIGSSRALGGIGRGEPIHWLVLSEVGFYTPEAIVKIVLPALQRVPPDGTVILESTPNGEEGYFYDEIQAALQGKSAFNFIVGYWWEEPDNSIVAGHPALDIFPDFRGDFDLTPDEVVLQAAHDLTLDQLRWRRWKKIELGEGMFQQEHLEDLAKCFLSVGQPYYDSLRMAELRNQVRPPIRAVNSAVIWEEPVPGAHYVMGADPGQARQTESVSWIFRYDNEYFERPQGVAMIAGWHEPSRHAKLSMDLGRMYNTALMCPEANSQGIAFIDGIIGKYPRIYYRRNPKSRTVSQEIGWYTGPSTKPFMMEELNRRMANIDIPDHETVRQIGLFRSVGDGRAATTALDDRHDAVALAMVAISNRSPNKRRGFKGASGNTGWDKK
jgi:hypothetical protein